MHSIKLNKEEWVIRKYGPQLTTYYHKTEPVLIKANWITNIARIYETKLIGGKTNTKLIKKIHLERTDGN